MTRRVAYIVTAPEQTARIFLRGHLSYLRSAGFQVTLIAPPGPALEEAAQREGVQSLGIPMVRQISPARDLVSLYRLWKALRKVRPHLVNASTPKGAFLGILAAALAGVPIRVYHLRALRLETCRGWKKWLLLSTEYLAASLSHRIICISGSLQRRFLQLGLAAPGKTVVFGQGSSNGVRCARFNPTPSRRQAAAALKTALGIRQDDLVVGYVGRMVPDKGVKHLIEAFELILKRIPRCRLLLVGSPELHQPVARKVRELLAGHTGIVNVSYVKDPAPYYQVMDVFAFPSLREGFGNVALEAAASGLPVVGFVSTGVVDAVQDGVTGTLVAPASSHVLGMALARYLEDSDLRRTHGDAGMQRARELFRPEPIWQAFQEEYTNLFLARGFRAVQLGETQPLKSAVEAS